MYQLKILEFERTEDILNIGVRIKGDYDPKVREPKIAIIFDNGTETRRIPLLVQAYFPEENLEKCTFFAKYGYNLSYLFFEKPENECIRFSFEMTYGDIIIEKMPFTISSDVRLDEDVLYRVTTEDENTFVYKRKTKIQQTKKITVVQELLQSIGVELWGLVLMVIGFPLLPAFVLEAVLELMGCAKSAPKNPHTGIKRLLAHVRWRYSSFTRKDFSLTKLKFGLVNTFNQIGRVTPVKQNRIVFVSNRRNDLSGNFEFVYNILKEDKNLDMRFVLDDRTTKEMGVGNAIRLGWYLATSKVILVDDFTTLVHSIPRREHTTLIQLWHACGAFKTFGYSRLGKQGGQKQASKNHRNYDYAIVSSQEITKFYAEGFGISLEKAIAPGIPRTDIFFDKAYQAKVTEQFYAEYPKLKEKKILLFAPTFRGNGKNSGFYPVDKFDVAKLYEELKGEYAIIVKHHPFVSDRSVIPEQYKDYIIDLSENSELNDLLFVADLLVTDYSSVIFEAALLDIPMLFYAYDLQRYIATRGFYYEFEKFVPGKIVLSFAQAIKAIKENDFEVEKIATFKTRFFDDLDGKSSERTVKVIYDSLQK